MSAGQWIAAAAFTLLMIGAAVVLGELLARIATVLRRDTAAIEAQNEALRERNDAKHAELEQRYGALPAAALHPDDPGRAASATELYRRATGATTSHQERS